MRIPLMPQGADAQALKASIREAARTYGVSEFLVLRILTVLLESWARAMAAAQIISVPGFGRFGAGVVHSRRYGELIVPMFFASRALRNEVRATCSIEAARASDRRLRSYKRSHATPRVAARTAKAMQAIRRGLDAEERRMGLRD